LSTHGITDALRDAELLARSVAQAGGAHDLDAALGRFAAARDRVAGPLFDAVDQISGYRWDLPRVRHHLLELSAAMSQELELIADTATVDRGMR
jgi:hypothetical protein